MSAILSFALAALVMPASAGYSVSSFKKETKRGANYWNVASALDGDLETCWMVDPEVGNRGQWIEVDTPVGHIDKISIVVGWDKDEETFLDYYRVKAGKVTVVNLDKGEDAVVWEGNVSFEDKRGWQVADIEDVKVGGEFGGGRVRLQVTEVYEGVDYPTLGVSEFLVHMREFDAKGASLAEAPGSSAEGKDPAVLLDGDNNTFWVSGDNGVGQSLQIDPGSYGVSSLGIRGGPKGYARAKKLEIEVDGATRTAELDDYSDMQWVLLPTQVGYTGSAWGKVKVTVLETFPSESGKGLAISELKLRATNVEDF